MTVEPIVDDRFQERWAASQKRSAANDVATRRKFFLIAALLVLSGAILSTMWLF